MCAVPKAAVFIARPRKSEIRANNTNRAANLCVTDYLT